MTDRPINRGSVIAGVFFILVGIAFLLEELDLWDLDAVYVLPVLLIALGVAVLLGGVGSRESRS